MNMNAADENWGKGIPFGERWKKEMTCHIL